MIRILNAVLKMVERGQLKWFVQSAIRNLRKPNGNLGRFLNDLQSLINSIPEEGIVTTLIDFYAIPSNFPGTPELKGNMSSEEKVVTLEFHLHKHFGNHRQLIPYIQMHEFEAFLFSHPDGFEKNIDPVLGDVKALLSIIKEFDNPELINTKKETSPSHRILKHYPDYKKNLMGNIMILDITIEQILQKCPRFKAWVDSIISRKRK